MKYTIIKNIFKGILLLGISYLLFFFINAFIALFRVESVPVEDYPLQFNIFDLLHISENNISKEYIICKKGEFMESLWLLDTNFTLSIINVGSYTEKFEWKDMIRHRESKIPDRSKWFNFDVGASMEYPFISQHYVPFYNTALLPLSKVNAIDIFIDGKKYPEILYGNSIMYIPVVAQMVSFSFNEINKSDLMFINKSKGNPSKAVLIFYRKDTRLYIGCIAKIGECDRNIMDFLKH